ncbi:histidinol dehydrogenase [Lentisphaerota bacterium WC36G]|nr:histidinol dehydrogenase [Lentisphaerae bacterium WC36]
MIKYNYKDSNFSTDIEKLYNRPSYPAEIEDTVKEVLLDIKNNGNEALIKYAKKFDSLDLTSETIKVSDAELKDAISKVDVKAKQAIKRALKNVESFSKERIPQPWSFSPRPGVILGERFEPMERIGVYIPGGTAPLVSSVIHTAGIAKAAGVKEIVAVTPANPDTDIHPAVLYAMKQAGVTEIYRLGGIYGIGAMAYGTGTIQKVEKIVGPGNAYVTAAKKLVYGEVAIDMIAGPSEIMVIADESSPAEFIAADLLSQAEHGSGLEQAVVVCDSAEVLNEVEVEVKKQAELLSRSETIDKVMNNGMFLIQVESMDQAAEIASKYAPEHLEIMCKSPGKVAKKVKAAGAIFIGKWTPEPVGDFTAGPSHVLPTAGSGKFFSGLTVEGFFRRMSILNYQKYALKDELGDIMKFAELEGLDAHGRSAEIRIKK